MTTPRPWSARRLAAALLVALPVIAHSDDCGPAPYECALAHVGRRDFPAAIALLEQQLAPAPPDLKVLNLLGIALTGAGRVDEANRRFQQALTLDRTFTPALKNLAVNEFTMDRVASAKARFEEVLARTPGDPIAHVHLAEIAHRDKRCAVALGHYEKAGERVAANPRWTLHHAQCLLDGKRHADALAALARLPKDDASAAFEAGVMLGRAEAYGEAARFFGLARRGGHDPDASVYNQVLMRIRAGDHAGAIEAGQVALNERKATKGDLHNLLAQAYLGAGRIQEAYDSLRTATRLEPDVEENYLDLATICLDHENFDLGLEIVDIGLLRLPASVRLRLQKGALLAMKGQLGQAEAEFDAARKSSTAGAIPHVALAMVWIQNGQTDKAIAMLRERTRTHAKEPLVLLMLGLALTRSGAEPTDPAADEALAAFEAAVRIDPGLADARAELGKLLLKRGDAKGAIAQLEKALAVDAHNVAAAYVLAQAYRRAGQPERAQEMMARVNRLNDQDLDPASDGALRRMVVRIVREGSAPPPATAR